MITAVRTRGVQGVEGPRDRNLSDLQIPVIPGFTLQSMILLKIFRESTFCNRVSLIRILKAYFSVAQISILQVCYYYYCYFICCENLSVNSLYTLNLSDLTPKVRHSRHVCNY
jgi:hypothetical protein